jgi:hypothetical protein
MSVVRPSIVPTVLPATRGFVRRASGVLAPGGGGGGNGFDDDFEADGALDPGLWTTYQPGNVPDVTKSGGLLLYSIEDGGGNESLWFGASQGRLDYQSPGAGPWRFEAYDVGAAVLDSPGTPLPFVSDEFQFAGIIYHHPTLATATYRACMAGHRNGNAQFTVEMKNTNSGSSTTRDEGDDVHTGLIDLAIEKAAGGAVTFQRRTGGGSWITCVDPSNLPTITDDWVVGVTAYKFTGFKRNFTGRIGGWAKVA